MLLLLPWCCGSACCQGRRSQQGDARPGGDPAEWGGGCRQGLLDLARLRVLGIQGEEGAVMEGLGHWLLLDMEAAVVIGIGGD